eukprot:TRINITY_DN2136_c0_g1_i3.p1 TRINITY_DN2136_c0_g1~~TRINITY_DN2136_c0_g1_i3.p1  ORF type:complete len:129 (+),score=40.22 TRINITY_DN2136_c0_g1_i3:117-503(+)
MLIENPLTTEELNRFLAWRETRATQPTTSKAEKGRKEEEKMKKWSKPNAQRFVRPAEYEPISTGTKNIPTDVQSPSDFLMLLFDDEAIQQQFLSSFVTAAITKNNERALQRAKELRRARNKRYREKEQ